VAKQIRANWPLYNPTFDPIVVPAFLIKHCKGQEAYFIMSFQYLTLLLYVSPIIIIIIIIFRHTRPSRRSNSDVLVHFDTALIRPRRLRNFARFYSLSVIFIRCLVGSIQFKPNIRVQRQV
jgi:hypothetical protein